MGARRGSAGMAAAGLLALLAAACTSDPTPGAQPTGTPSSSPGSGPSSTPGSSPGATSSQDAEPGPPPARQPLVLAVNPRRPPLDIGPALARRVVRGEVDDWSALGEPAGPLVVTERPRDLASLPTGMLAVVPADAVGPQVRVVDVGGVDPLREPRRYPLRTAADHAPPVPTTMTVVGDIMLGRRVGDRAAAEGDPAYSLRPMQDRLAAADLTIGNLENTLSTAGPPTQGGDSFAAVPSVRAGLRDAGFDAIGLANNHLGDFGDQALVETVERLRAGRLDSFGAGRNPSEAWAPVILERHGTRFGFLGFNAIGETREVGPGQPGAVSVSMPPRTGPLDRAELDRFLRAVRRLDRLVDVVTVLPHWGEQYTPRPEPIQGQVAGELVRAGADLVVGGHPHWVQGASMRGDALVVHSLGNFVFDMYPPETREGLVLEAVFWGDELKAAEFVPYRIGDDLAPRVVTHGEAAANLDRFWQFSGLGASPT
jgi:poly-gamma-glutamate capsule biosynthesis protein CapA/YwtB (metallophosphatase superfamily)